MLIKVSSFHVYDHLNENDSNKIENCSICDIVSLNQQNQFLISPEIIASNADLIFAPYQANYKTTQNSTDSGAVFIYFSRPPPTLA